MVHTELESCTEHGGTGMDVELGPLEDMPAVATPPPDGHSGRLRRRLLAGTGSGEDLREIAAALDLPATTEDRAIAQALVRTISERSQVQLHLATASAQPLAPRIEEVQAQLVHEPRASYLVRLPPELSERSGERLSFDDIRTLIAVIHAGTLRQRRAATLRLGEFFRDPRGLTADQTRHATDTLVHLRKFEIAYELSAVCSQLPGAEGRRARAGRREWDQLVTQVEQDVRAFWDGELSFEPISSQHIDQQVQLLVRTRDLPDELANHLCAVIEGTDGRASLADRAALISALLNAADPRLLPSLRRVLELGESELVRPAARALSRIEDPRVHSVLVQAYGRALRSDQRLALAGALGMVGDMRGHDYVRQVLTQLDSPLLAPALQALDTLGTSEDEQLVLELLERDEPDVLMAAVRTLARFGDGRALVPLNVLRTRTDRSALRAEIEETRIAVLARLELLGEEPPAADAANEVFDTTKRAAIAKHRDPTWVQLRALWSLLIGYLFRLLGAHAKAVGRFEEAATLRPSWVAPVVAMALAYSRHGNHASALSTFRRALDIDRDQVEQNPTAVRHIAQSFLRRAEAVELDGRIDIAYGLLEEVLALDLRKAPSGLRFALAQRLEFLRARAA